MLNLSNIKPAAWSRQTSKRLWRGNGSGKWTFSGKWCKGQNARSGWGVPDWFEWGQTPLFRRMPKLKGFSNAMFKVQYNIVNISDIALLASKGISEINKETLLQNRVIRHKALGIKLLWDWSIDAKVTVTVNKASSSAKEAVLNAGGKLELI